MKGALLFDFFMDIENRTIHIKREFEADLELVWEAWTTAELLDKNPLRLKTDFAMKTAQ